MKEFKLKKGIYQHYKGNLYEVIGIATHSENLEELVLYRAMYGKKEFWVRPLKMFSERIKIDGKLVERFKFIEK